MTRAGQHILDSGDRFGCAFQRAMDTLSDEGIRVVVLRLKETAATLGSFYDERRGVLQSTGYVIEPDGTSAVGQDSSGPIGRLVRQDVLGLVQHCKKQA